MQDLLADHYVLVVAGTALKDPRFTGKIVGLGVWAAADGWCYSGGPLTGAVATWHELLSALLCMYIGGSVFNHYFESEAIKALPDVHA